MSLPANQDAEQQEHTPRHRPLVPVLLGFAVGIWLDEVLHPEFAVWAATGCVLMGFALAALAHRSWPWANWVLAAFLLVPLGGAYHCTRVRQSPPWHLRRRLTQRMDYCSVRAEVTKEPELQATFDPWEQRRDPVRSYWLVRVEVAALAPAGEPWRRAAGGMVVFADGDRPLLQVGDQVEFRANLRPNRPATNPGETDTREVYERWGSFGTATVRSPKAFKLVRPSHWYSSVPAAVGRLRTRLKEALIWDADQPTHALTSALILGERSHLSESTRDLLAEAGALHFIAISGLHVGLFAAFWWVVLVRLRMPVQARSLVLIALVWLYVAFTGAHVSSQRAAWMLTFVAAAPLVQRRSDSVSAMLGAGLLILALRPQELFAVGFQFTFAAVWAILYLYANLADILWPWDRLSERLEQERERHLGRDLLLYGRHYLLLSGCIWLALVPLQAHYFHHFSPYTPLVNLALWPLMLLLIVGSFLLMPAALLGRIVAQSLVGATGCISTQCESLLEATSRLPGFAVHTPGPPVWWILAFYVVLVLWIFRAQVRGGHGAFLAGVLVLAVGYICADVGVRKPEHVTVTVADVGHGQCVVFRLPSGATMLYDAGSAAGRRVRGVEGILWDRRVRRIQTMLISHRDADHCRFAPNIARKFTVDTVGIPPFGVGEAAMVLDERLRDRVARRVAIWEGVTLTADGMRCKVLHPDDRFLTGPGITRNDRSMVVLCESEGRRILLTGDVDEQALRRLVDAYGDELRADVLVLPHHGAWRPALREFLERVRPALAVASCYDDVDPGTRQLLEQMGVTLWTTAEHGAITMTLGGDELRMESYLRPLENTLLVRYVPPAPASQEGAGPR